MAELLTRDQILSNGELPSAIVYVEELGGSVKLRMMSSEEQDDFDIATAKIREAGGDTSRNLRARMVAACCVDDGGNRLFTEEDVTSLGRKSSRVIRKLWLIASKLNGYEDEEDEGELGN